jgi:hypothetical protein
VSPRCAVRGDPLRSRKGTGRSSIKDPDNSTQPGTLEPHADGRCVGGCMPYAARADGAPWEIVLETNDKSPSWRIGLVVPPAEWGKPKMLEGQTQRSTRRPHVPTTLPRIQSRSFGSRTTGNSGGTRRARSTALIGQATAGVSYVCE